MTHWGRGTSRQRLKAGVWRGAVQEEEGGQCGGVGPE